MSDVTAILTSYKRGINVPRIIDNLARQSIKPRIVLIDTENSYSGEGADEVWRVPRPVGAYPRWQIASYYGPWIYIQDDDILPTSPYLIESLLEKSKGGRSIIGPRARDVWFDVPHYMHDDAIGPMTNNIKGGCCLFNRYALNYVRTPPDWVTQRCDDLWVSLETGRGKKIHVVAKWARDMIMDLPVLASRPGFCKEPEHYTEREAFCARWLTENLS
jgi:hypothetical protein